MSCCIGGLIMLSNLYNQTYTIINQIPTSQKNAKKRLWVKRYLKHCDKIGGVYDKTSGVLFLSDEAFTVYIKDWEHYRPAVWTNGGYYTLPDNTKSEYFTAARGDLIIFDKINDPAPVNGEEFDALIDKYKGMGGTLSDVMDYINYKNDGTPWRTNHIELIKR